MATSCGAVNLVATLYQVESKVLYGCEVSASEEVERGECTDALKSEEDGVDVPSQRIKPYDLARYHMKSHVHSNQAQRDQDINIMAKKGVVEEEGRVEEENEGSLKRRRTGSRLCDICRKAGHNARTSPEAGEMDSSCDSE